MKAMNTNCVPLACLVLTFVGASGIQVSPVQQVIQMLTDMDMKAKNAKAAEEKIYTQYKEWVGDRSTDLGFEIKTSLSSIEELKATIEQLTSKIASLSNAIDERDGEINQLETEKADATKARDAEHAEYLKLQKDFAESVDALQRAIETLSAQAFDRPQAEAMLQKMAKTTPGMSRVLAAFFQEKANGDGAPAVAAYKFQSDSIVQLLKKLLGKFQSQLDEVETEESNQAHYYNLQNIHLSNTIEKTKSEREAMAVRKGEATAALARANTKLAETEEELAADQALLAEIKATFEAKTKTFAANQQIRAEELEALGKAIEIISSPAVADSYSEHVKLAQLAARPPASFLQMHGSSKRRIAARQRAVEYLQHRAKALSSKVLSSFAAQVAANPFAKVIEMIEDLLARLKEQAGAEAEHKAWCDEQLKNNKLKREKKTAKVAELSASIDQLAATIQEQGEQIEALVKGQEELATAMAEATSERQKEKAMNTDTIADAQAGTQAVRRALEILREFYSPQALLQTTAGQVPEMEAYGGLHGQSKGVIGMLEVIETDFTRLEAETTAAEKQAQNEYDNFMKEAEADKRQKHAAEVKMRLDKDQNEFEKGETTKNLAAVEAELTKANEYFDALKPNCLEIHVDYAARAARRQEEIAALKDAYAILDSKTLG